MTRKGSQRAGNTHSYSGPGRGASDHPKYHPEPGIAETPVDERVDRKVRDNLHAYAQGKGKLIPLLNVFDELEKTFGSPSILDALSKTVEYQESAVAGVLFLLRRDIRGAAGEIKGTLARMVELARGIRR
jgi:hypothetical protein